MSLPDILLDSSWSIHYIPNTRARMPTLRALLISTSTTSQASIDRQLRALSDECCLYLRSQGRAEPVDELNDERDRTGSLRECAVSRVVTHGADVDAVTAGVVGQQVLGLVIETRYQKATYQVVLLARRDMSSGNSGSSTSSDDCPFSTVLYKASRKNLRQVKGWLEETFHLPASSQLQLGPEVLARMCSVYLEGLSASWQWEEEDAAATVDEALRQAMLKQAVGNLKLTVAFSGAAGEEIAPRLRTMEFDVPGEAVYALLKRARARGVGEGTTGTTTVLDELGRALYEKMGLRLPFTGVAESPVGNNGTPPAEPPVKVTKISCAGFAVGVEGKLKFAGRPVENAAVVGYEEGVVREAYWGMLEIVLGKAERRGGEDGV